MADQALRTVRSPFGGFSSKNMRMVNPFSKSQARFPVMAVACRWGRNADTPVYPYLGEHNNPRQSSYKINLGYCAVPCCTSTWVKSQNQNQIFLVLFRRLLMSAY